MNSVEEMLLLSIAQTNSKVVNSGGVQAQKKPEFSYRRAVLRTKDLTTTLRFVSADKLMA